MTATSSSRLLLNATGVLLIAAPIVALVLKGLSTGWMMVLLIMGPIIVLVIGYTVQIVVAAQGFLSKRALFAKTGDRQHDKAASRATIAAWLTSVGIMLLGIFMPDGGDSAYGSTFQLWLGAYGPNADAVHRATDSLNDIAALLVAGAWFFGFFWLCLEWVIALSRRRQVGRYWRYEPMPQQSITASAHQGCSECRPQL